MARSETYTRFRGLLDTCQFDEALDLAEGESARSGQASVFWLTQQAVAARRGGRLPAALCAAQAALRLDPHSAYALLARAEIHLALGDAAAAQGDFEELCSDARVGESARTGLLRCLEASAQWLRLLELLDRWGLTGAERPRWRSRALAALGRDEEALAECRAWLALCKDHPPALWQLLELELRREPIVAVRQRYARLARIPSRPTIYREIHASLCRRCGDEDAAVQEYRTLYRGGGAHSLRRREAFALARGGREVEAIPLLEELLDQQPGDRYLHASYAAACRRSGQLERAWRFYTTLLDRHPEQKGLHGRLRRLRTWQGQGTS